MSKLVLISFIIVFMFLLFVCQFCLFVCQISSQFLLLGCISKNSLRYGICFVISIFIVLTLYFFYMYDDKNNIWLIYGKIWKEIVSTNYKRDTIGDDPMLHPQLISFRKSPKTSCNPDNLNADLCQQTGVTYVYR